MRWVKLLFLVIFRFNRDAVLNRYVGRWGNSENLSKFSVPYSLVVTIPGSLAWFGGNLLISFQNLMKIAKILRNLTKAFEFYQKLTIFYKSSQIWWKLRKQKTSLKSAKSLRMKQKLMIPASPNWYDQNDDNFESWNRRMIREKVSYLHIRTSIAILLFLSELDTEILISLISTEAII